MVSNGRRGYSGHYFSVRNIATDNGLSFETLGLLKDDSTPSFSMVAFIVQPFIGAPVVSVENEARCVCALGVDGGF